MDGRLHDSFPMGATLHTGDGTEREDLRSVLTSKALLVASPWTYQVLSKLIYLIQSTPNFALLPIFLYISCL